MGRAHRTAQGVRAGLARRRSAPVGARRLVAAAGAGRARGCGRSAADRQRLPAPGRDQRAAAGPAGVGAEHLGRLGRAARSRLHRVLRLRRLRVRAPVLEPARPRHPSARGALDPDRDGRRGVSGADRGAAVAAPDRRLPGDHHAVLRRGVRRVHQQRRAEQARRAERDRRDRPDQGVRRADHHQPRLLLSAADPAGGGGRARSTCSTPRAPAAPGARCERTRSRPR